MLAYFGTKLGLTLPHSRSQESEADLLGLEIAAKAGFNPDAAITLWKKVGAPAERAEQ
ncbi:M48 family metalloprotease (plasmid) [Acinetobacter baumannii]